jgi:hypothetical protein|tara:strand:+ start:7691 stop:7861 length:171 start_codon:yes stop_codon:yes gene_type:complete
MTKMQRTMTLKSVAEFPHDEFVTDQVADFAELVPSILGASTSAAESGILRWASRKR